ncbi:tripartite tricarboxylate transporter TctB family protein [Ammoniphilus sp. 3BR4]|uniref:tripartite tricarboxylate transporter TctB family protein n=1 Tax=Ammoniphilus sp. 3BR4 TaxID=3158265 RepID=UPI003467903B
MTAGKYIPPLMIVVSLAVFAMSYNIEDSSIFDPSSPSFFPAVVGVVMFLCSLLIFRRGSQPSSSLHQKAQQHESGKKKKEDEDEEEDLYEAEIITPREINVRLILFTVLVVLFAILMNYLNFMLVSFLFLLGSMLLLSKERKFRSFLVSGITSVAFYYIFVYVFHIVFP